MSDARLVFFTDLFRRSLELVARFPLTVEPPRMAQITGVLEPAAGHLRRTPAFPAPPHARPSAVGGEHAATGLNTVGMLLDRLSILSIKHWNLVHRRGAAQQAETLAATQVEELIRALAEARPGFSSLNNKMTNHTVDAESSSFPEAYSGLLTTNLLLWEAQEILYNHDINALPCEELRAYIEFFSRGNLQRNYFIEASDALFWRDSEIKPC